MRKMIRRLGLCFLLAVGVWTAALVYEHQNLEDSLIRFHVVANSDGEDDQEVKLLVRDAVLQSIQQDLGNVADVEQAKQYLQDNLPKIEALANTVLESAGFEETAVVSLCKEAFQTRDYDTFSLPAGVYEALRIMIGEGEGQNWWCVSFPALCMAQTEEVFAENAQSSGISRRTADTLMHGSDYQVRFYLLDMIGQIENSFFRKG